MSDGPLQAGTKGHKIAFGDASNTFTYDLDENGSVINLMPSADNPLAGSAELVALEEPIAEEIAEAEVAAEAADESEAAPVA